jgi:WD40 repeat protein
MIKIYRLLVALCVMLSAMLVSFPSTAQDRPNREIITVENAASVSEVAALEGHEGAVNSVAFNSDGNLLASGGDDGTIQL